MVSGGNNFINIDGYDSYNEYSINRADSVIDYVLSGVNHSTDKLNIDIPDEINITLNLENNEKIVSAIYRSPSSDKNNFLNYLHDVLNKFKHYNNHFIMGDFNFESLDESIETYLHIAMIPYLTLARNASS